MNDAPNRSLGRMTHERMTRERWEYLAPLIDSILDTPVDQRLMQIAKICGDDEALSAELLQFIDADAEDPIAARQASVFEKAERERTSLLSERLFDSSFDLLSQLQQSLGATYTIEREIVGGGMSRVFIADEKGLGRKVVIKVLPSELTAGISSETLTREIRLAASLQQANIVPVLSAGTAAGFPFYTMPLVERRSLHERLEREGALPVNEAISIMRDVARALAFAHDRGIIHRDIKPGNILLSDRTAIVTDFGIAKALRVAGEATESMPAIRAAMGTPAYIAPEQAAGSPDIDRRADIYSFGCVAWEMLTGRTAFSGSTSGEIIAAHFQQTPPAVSALRPEVPARVSELIASCMEREPARRPGSATEILQTLDLAVSEPAASAGRKSIRGLMAVASIALIAVSVAALSYYRSASNAAKPLTFAAIPFLNAAHDTSLDYRSDGIGDEVLNAMSKVGGVQVVGRSTAFRYRAKSGTDVLPIHRALGARLLLTGTLRESAGRVTVSAQLNDSAARGEIWADSFTSDAADFASVSGEMVQRISTALRTRFGSRVVVPSRAVFTAGTTNAAALDLYLIGQSQLRRRGSGIAQSITTFQRAIDLDSGYARAHAALSTALDLDPFFEGTLASQVTMRADSEARRALELDSTLADAHAALGAALAFAARWDDSDREMRRAIALNPDDAMIRQTFARQVLLRGGSNEALAQLQTARVVEPTSPLIAAWLSYAFFLAGRRDSAIIESERAIELDPTGLAPVNLASLVSLGLGRMDKARQIIAAPLSHGMTNAAYVYAKLGDTATANRINRDMERRNPRPWFVDVSEASVFLATGDSAAALSALERSARNSGSLWVFFIPLGDPAYDLVRPNPRFAALLRRANLDPAGVRTRLR